MPKWIGDLPLLPMPSFRGSILHIVCLRAKEEVPRILARWVITSMQDIQVIRNWAVGKLPGNAVSIHNTPCAIPAAPDQESSVTTNTETLPFPAGVGAAGAVDL